METQPNRLPGTAGGNPSRTERLILDRYRLLSRIGSGRLGVVYEARDEGEPGSVLDNRVAVQVIDSRFADHDSFLDELRRGYTALRKARHQNIVEIIDFRCDGRTHFLVMERLEGVSLRALLNDITIAPAAEVAAVIRAVGDALQYLNAKSLVHGHLTPRCVFVTFDCEIKLLDIVPVPFGSTALRDVASFAPEFEADRDERDEVFSLACLAYELLAGRHPFNACSPGEALRSGLRPAPIESLSARCWQALSNGLSLDREQRTPGISAWLREFGIAGTERLQPTAGRPDDVGFGIAARESGAAEPMGAGEGYDAGTELDLGRDIPAHRMPEARRGLGRSTMVAVLAAALAIVATLVYVYRQPLREGASEPIAAGIAYLTSLATSGETDAGRGSDVPPAGESVPGRGTPTTSGVEEPLSGPEARAPDSVPAVPAVAPTRAANAQPDDTVPGEREVSDDSGAPASQEAEPQEVEDNNDPDPPTRVASLVTAEPSVTSREGASFVPVSVRRTGDATQADSIVWWTSPETALGGNDYADFGMKTEAFAPGETTLVLHVPLVDDGLPEPAEHFLVHIGRRNPETGQPEPLASTRVEITDDD